LPDPDEDPELWRNRVRQAWVKDPDFRIDSLRMTEIARAQRLEELYHHLDSEGVHFRFNPGPLPERPAEAAISAGEPGTARAGQRRDAIFCAPAPVEAILLEYARLKDEAQSAGESLISSAHVVLVPIAEPARGTERFYEQCDGQSNLVEIADRMGWPMRQLMIVATTELRRGALRPAQPDELIDLARMEFQPGNLARAASRLCAWCECSWPGPPTPIEAELFTSEWDAGRLQVALRGMPPRAARTLLRRIDHALGSPLTSVQYWQELASIQTADRLTALRLMFLQVRANIDPNVPPLRDLLAVARSFAENKNRMRAASILRIAAARMPDSTAARLEVGNEMLAVGMVAEGTPWIVEAARTFVAAGNSDRALGPLRAVIAASPSNRDARRLLAKARARIVQKTLTRKNSFVTMAVVLALSIGAWVQIGTHRAEERKISEIASHLAEPRVALQLLLQHFPDEMPDRVQSMKASLEERIDREEHAVRTSWTDLYREAQVEATLGDPVLGLRRALELPPPPDETLSKTPWPLVSDLFNGLGARLAKRIGDVGTQVLDTPEQMNDEQRIASLVAELRTHLVPHIEKPDVKAFDVRLGELAREIEERQDQRAQARVKRLKQDNLARQDQILGAARAHAQARDYTRALTLYKQLIESDESGKLKDLPALNKEMKAIEQKHDALVKARELALGGQHDKARALLNDNVDRADDYLLPWRVTTVPAGARARLKDGSVHVTPFVLESSAGERISMTLELEAHDPLKLEVDQPEDRLLYFSRRAERAWTSQGRVEALPVAVGDEHVVCDRSGQIARLTKSGTAAWQHKLPSLGGVARAPVFLPKKQGFLLLVTEDGEAWIVEAASGLLEGPWAMKSPPVHGPVATPDGVSAVFRDDTRALWTTRLRPDVIPVAAAEDALDESAQRGSSSGMAVLRRRAGEGTTLESPWSNWMVEVGAEVYTVRAKDSSAASFTVLREGEWTYVAWEAPHSLIPRGRLWIADSKGLRSFLP
jgi:tetratricopeptide (TPR) repeat protein